ncbi:MAG: CAP domain-containing protein [Kribbellaceae bacterium]|nr:CAP domain-containing protein [Kribbellaceae bacterium]
MTNHRRSPSKGVAGPLLASLSALVLLAGVGWFVVRETGTPRATSQDTPITTALPADDASSAPPARRTTLVPTPTRSTSAPSRGSTRTPAKSTYTPRHTATPTPSPTRTRTATPTSTTTFSPSPTRTTKTPKPAGGSGPAEEQVLTLTNQERAKSGCGPLRFNKSLVRAAEAHAADMVDQHYFAHDSLDGRSPFDRMKAAGFTGGSMAENIAVGYSSPAAVVAGWMQSPGHRANILNCAYTMIGIGYDPGQVKPDWGNGSWVQDFGG